MRDASGFQRSSRSTSSALMPLRHNVQRDGQLLSTDSGYRSNSFLTSCIARFTLVCTRCFSTRESEASEEIVPPLRHGGIRKFKTLLSASGSDSITFKRAHFHSGVPQTRWRNTFAKILKNCGIKLPGAMWVCHLNIERNLQALCILISRFTRHPQNALWTIFAPRNKITPYGRDTSISTTIFCADGSLSMHYHLHIIFNALVFCRSPYQIGILSPSTKRTLDDFCTTQ